MWFCVVAFIRHRHSSTGFVNCNKRCEIWLRRKKRYNIPSERGGSLLALPHGGAVGLASPRWPATAICSDRFPGRWLARTRGLGIALPIVGERAGAQQVHIAEHLRVLLSTEQLPVESKLEESRRLTSDVPLPHQDECNR